MSRENKECGDEIAEAMKYLGGALKNVEALEKDLAYLGRCMVEVGGVMEKFGDNLRIFRGGKAFGFHDPGVRGEISVDVNALVGVSEKIRELQKEKSKIRETKTFLEKATGVKF